MKKLVGLLLFLSLNISFLNAQTKKDGTPDMRYKANKEAYGNYSSPSTTYSSSKTKKTTYSNYSVARDKNGKIKRSASVKRAFMKQTGHPHGWSGHVVDHIKPLKEGGCDCPENMQWQTIEEAKAKDKWE